MDNKNATDSQSVNNLTPAAFVEKWGPVDINCSDPTCKKHNQTAREQMAADLAGLLARERERYVFVRED